MVHLVLRIYPQILKTLETTLLEYSGAWEKLIHEKILKSKSRGIVPLSAAGLEEIGFVKILIFYMKHLQILDDFLSLCIYAIC